MNKICFFIFLFIGCCAAKNYAQDTSVQLLRLDFENKKAVKKAKLKGKYKRMQEDGNSVLYIRSTNASSKRWVTIPLPDKIVAGSLLRIKVKVKAENVSIPPHAYNGIKVMLKAITPWGPIYPQYSLPQGSFGWREILLADGILAGSKNTELVLGLEECTGEVWFDDLEVSVVPLGNMAGVGKKPYTGHQEPRLRGMMVNAFATADDLRTLASWGANLVRWQMTWDGFPRSKADTASLYAYKNWLYSVADHIEQLIPLCRDLGIKVVLDMHSVPGGRLDGKDDFRIFNDKYWQDAFLEIWKELALRFKDETVIWAYDLANEPVEGTVKDGLMTWVKLAKAAVANIRSVDTMHTIIIEGSGGYPPALLGMEPVNDPKVVYSFHLYGPISFTHQGVLGYPVGVFYPSVIKGVLWNKQRLELGLKTIKDWQRKYNVHLYVGEFSAIRWAPGNSAYNYLRDCIEIFEEAGWDWTYHAFREWNGWSVEHGSDMNDNNVSATPTQRQQLLMEWFKKK